MENNFNSRLSVGRVDWWSILIYAILVLAGWLNIYAAVYDDMHSSIFDISQRYGMQLLWMGVSAFLAISILLIDAKYYHILAFPLYWITILILIVVLFVGKEVNGARSWIMIGPIALQPTEFVKFTTSLALARYMSSYSFDLRNWRDLLRVFGIIGLPVAIIMLQNDTGSALVYGSFLFMFYREGFNRWIYVALFMVISLFVFYFLLEPATLLILMILGCVLSEGISNGYWRSKLIYLAALTLFVSLLYLIVFLLGGHLSLYAAILIGVVLSLGLVAVYAYRYKIRNILLFVLLFFGSLAFTSTIEYGFNNILQIHQQKRILDLLGLESDLAHWGYNVNQSKIAIGSGGFAGKGFLEGTQTKFNFVPEQSTDFIFCTIGEEQGFVGTVGILLLFGLLLVRIIQLAERQRSVFGRVYGYCVAAIIFFHLAVNIGMVIGVLPVIGIPLPFFSYGGSSLWGFTILLFTLLCIDASRNDTL